MDNKLTFYKMLLDKFADIINENQKRTVGEVKLLVQPLNEQIGQLIEKYIKQPYRYEKDYLFTAQHVFDHIVREIKYVPNELSVNFWLTPEEILTNKVSDDEDLAILVCSVLRALGDEKVYVYVMELEDLRTHAVVMSDINGKTLLLDPCTGHGFFKYYGDKAYVFKRYQFDGKKIKRALYRFNDQTYEQFF